jgi:hypothetical protein
MPADYQKQQFDWSAQQAKDTQAANARAAEADALTCN